ncbi:hypothetical protein J4E89_010382 [Alternaria sp. Ai002NY15]|nr:hypothetical protein J4E89_010382 [Alternaria sp. Ai002NY15]
MLRNTLSTAAALAACVATAQASLNMSDSSFKLFKSSLSQLAEVYLPGSEEFANATVRWGAGQTPHYDMIVKVATEEDVQESILYANANDKPFHAISGAHATTTYLNNITNAVGIFMRGMNDIFIVDDGDTALIQGGILNGDVIDFLGLHDKQTMTTACACVGYVSPILGGGHGWNQGRYGLASDQLVSARMVLANGTAITVNESSPDLFWAIRGAGHNFGLVTQAEIKIYDKKPVVDGWAVSGYFFTHDKMEDVVAVANTWMTAANRSVSLEHYVVFSFDPEVDPVNPIVIIWVIYQGADTVPAQYTDPFVAMSPINTESGITDLGGVSRFTGADSDGPSCTKGYTRSLVPVSADTYDAPSLREVIDIMTTFPAEFRSSAVLLESYSTNRVGEIPSDSTAYPDRNGQLLFSPFMTYDKNASLDALAWDYAGKIRDTMINGTNKPYESYINYARGDETTEQLYGYEPWRLEKLRKLKKEYDPFGKFNFFAPILGEDGQPL